MRPFSDQEHSRAVALGKTLARPTRWDIAAFAVLGAFAILIAATFLQYGVTWDEQNGSLNGEYFLRWYSTGFRDTSVFTVGNQRLYGSFFNGISRLLGEHSPFGPYETSHLLIALFGWIGALYAFRLGKLIRGAKAGFLSVALLILTPAYYGHSFNNPKDIPFAALFMASLYYLVRAYGCFPKLNWKAMVTLGITVGLMLGVRVGGIFVFAYYLVLLGLWALGRVRQDSHYSMKRVSSDLMAGSVWFFGVVAIAWAVMLVWWPYAQASPLANPLNAIRADANFKDYPYPVLFDGTFIRPYSLPWKYLPTWFAITLPEFYFAAFAFAALAFVPALRTAVSPGERRTLDYDFGAKVAFLGFAIVFPVAAAIGFHSIVYDANRHFLFIIPPLAVLAGTLLAWFLEQPVKPVLRFGVLGVVAVSAVCTISDMVQLHPYESVYFNRSFGGLRAAFGRYETDYWAASTKEGMEWLAKNYWPGAPERSIRVGNMSRPFQTSYYIQSRGAQMARFTPVGQSEIPNVVLATTRWNRHTRFKGKILHVVERMGIPLLFVIEVRAPS